MRRSRCVLLPKPARTMPDSAPAGAKPVDIKAVFDLKPVDAIAFLEAKQPKTTVAWSEMMHEEHAASFTVAKVAKLDLLADIQASLVKAQDEGMPFAQWQAEIEPTLVNAGWMGLVTDEKLTGTEKPVFIGPRRLRTIYDTNLRMSRAKGQWDRIQKVKAKRPFLRYSAVMDSRTRPQHAAWHGTILPVDHPFWLTHFPPCGWHCRCTAQQLSQRDLDHRGWTVTPDAKVPDLTANVPFYRKGSSVPMFVPRGVDPGFAYNPGVSRTEAAAGKAAQSLIDAHAAGDGDAAAAVLDELLGDAVTTKLPDSAVPAMLKLIAASDYAALAKMLADLIGAK